MPNKTKRPALFPAQIEQLICAARNGPTLFARERSGAVSWLLSGIARSMMYRLIAEVGVRADELLTLTPDDFWLGDDLPTAKLGLFTRPGRRGLHLPLEGAMKAALAEYLSERPDDAPLFALNGPGSVERVLAFDASQAGLSACSVSVEALEAFYIAKLDNAAARTSNVWGDLAVELTVGNGDRPERGRRA